MALQRFYSARYYSLFSNSFSEGSAVQDENGAYLGFTWTPASRWNITAYSDFAYFVWPKYQTRESTHSWDNLVSNVFMPILRMQNGLLRQVLNSPRINRLA